MKKNSTTHPYFNLLNKISYANWNMNTLNIDKYTFLNFPAIFQFTLFCSNDSFLRSDQ